MADSNLRVTELSYDTLRDNLKNYLKSQTTLQDYNFEGSTLAIILDLLAYNTYYNAFYANMAGNESFIDTAVLRESVVSRAKELDYIPRSRKSAIATVNMAFSDANTSFTIPKDFNVRATLNGFQYHFSTAESQVFYSDSGFYTFNLDVYEGSWTTQTFMSTDPGFGERFVILNEGVDVDSITVQVKPSALSSDVTTYNLASDILDVDGDSEVYFIVENLDGNYEIVFGDGILGKQLTVGNQILLNYRTCNGSAPNGIQSFGKESDIFPNFTLTAVTAAAGGLDKEDIESIRFNAPREYDIQGRVVTIEDYIQRVMRDNADIQSLAVWGGEDNDPPVYGKVFLSAKPYDGFSLTQTRKNAIITALEKYNVQSIDPLIIDPTFVYIVPTSRVFVDSSLTVLSAADIRNLVDTTLSTFEANQLSLFDRRFRYSQMIEAIDNTNVSIKSNDTDVKFQKRFSPILGSFFNYYVKFYTSIYHPYDGFLGAVSSNRFTLTGISEQLFLDDDGRGNLRAYYPTTGNAKVYINKTMGTVDYTTGEIRLDNFNPSSYEGTEIEVTITPENRDLAPQQNQILLVSDSTITVIEEATGNILSSGSGTTEGDTASQFETPISSTITV